MHDECDMDPEIAGHSSHELDKVVLQSKAVVVVGSGHRPNQKLQVVDHNV